MGERKLTTNRCAGRLTSKHTLKQRRRRPRDPAIRALGCDPARVNGVARRGLDAVAWVPDAREEARRAGDRGRRAVAVRDGGAHCAVCCVDEGGAGPAGWV
jgi:hypothetical protein